MRQGERMSVRQGARRAGYIATIIVHIVLTYVFNNLLNWRVPYLTDDFVAPLVFFNISFVANIVANAAFLLYDARWFRRLAQIILNVIGFVAILVLFTVFPFEFPPGPWDLVGRIALVAIMFGIAIGTIVELVRLVAGRD